MSQYDFGTIDPFVVDGEQLADMLNQWRNAVHSMHRGATRPAYAVAGQMWVNDAAGPTAWLVNVYMGGAAGDKGLFTYNSTLGSITMVDGLRAITQDADDSTQLLATTEFVQSAIAAATTTLLGSLLPTGTVVDLIGGAVSMAAVPTGWVPAIQGTIGAGPSGASIRANADCEALFKHIWRGMTNANAPVLPGGRGPTEDSDWIANKTIGGLDLRGRVRATMDNWGGTAGGILSAIAGMGANGGAQTHTLTTTEMPSHNHYGLIGQIKAEVITPRGVGWGDGTNAGYHQETQLAGGGGAHNNVQPTRNVGTIIKL